MMRGRGRGRREEEGKAERGKIYEGRRDGGMEGYSREG
jgi:hypothetical protein